MDFYRRINGNLKSHVDGIKKISGYNCQIHGWDDIYRIGADGYIVSIGVLLIDEGVIRSTEWADRMKIIIYPILKEAGCSCDGFDEILKNVWNSHFLDNPKIENKIRWDSDIKKHLPKVKDLAVKRASLCIRVLNNNIVLVASCVLVIIFSLTTNNLPSYNINREFWIDHSNYDSGLLGKIIRNALNYRFYIWMIEIVIFIIMMSDKRLYKFSPFAVCLFSLVSCIPFIIIKPYDYFMTFEIVRSLALSGLIYFFLYPIIWINADRVFNRLNTN